MKKIFIAILTISIFSFCYAEEELVGKNLSQDDYLYTQYNHNKNKLLKNNHMLTVGTYNIASGLSGHKANINDIGNAIKQLNVDIIGLQEVDKNADRSGNVDQIEELKKITGMEGFFGKTINLKKNDKIVGEYGIGILSKYPIEKVKYYNIPSGDYEQRGIIVAKIKNPNFDVPVYFLNTHTDWHHNNKVRLEQAEYFDAFTTDDADVRADFPDMLTGIMILTGDFNDVPNSDVINKMSLFWNRVSNEKLDNRTWPAANPSLELDHIFTSKGQKWELNNVHIPNSENDWKKFNWPLVSDHLPIVVKMKLLEQ